MHLNLKKVFKIISCQFLSLFLKVVFIQGYLGGAVVEVEVVVVAAGVVVEAVAAGAGVELEDA